MLQFLQENPVLGIITAVTAILTALNSFVGAFGLPPFWADALISLVLTYSVFHWILYTWKSVKMRRSVGLAPIRPSGSQPISTILRGIGLSILIPITLFVLLVLNATPVVSHIRKSDWVLCGTFVISCTDVSCIELYDARNRKVSDHCYPLDDDSGYKYLKGDNWWIYQPSSVSSRCKGQTSTRYPLDPTMFNLSCDGTVKIQ